jgi:polysaccharide chain length determinant protein (PEP-CTERM system associated)
MNPELKYYLSVFVKRLPLFLFVFVTLTFASLAAAILLPTIYVARATLLVEDPQIPEGLASSTVRVGAAEQLEIFQKRLLTRANLVDIAREYNVFDSGDNLSPDQIVDQMRESTRMRSSTGRNRATLLEVGFEGRSAALAANVTNEYVTRILADSARMRTQTASDTLEFFEQEAERLGVELEVQSARIVEFQNQNADALPSSLNYRMGRQSEMQLRLATLEREQISLRDQKTRLQQLFDATGGSGSTANERRQQMSPDEQQLADLRRDLSELLGIYSESNPRVTVLRSRIESLEKTVSGESAAAITAPTDPEAMTETASRESTVLDVQLREIDSIIQFNNEQIESIKVELEELSDSIERTPNNIVALEALQREYANVQTQYNQAIGRLSAAATGERIEVLSKGQRISVIEQAVPPDEPSSPNRPLIAGGGTFVAFGLAIGLVILLETLNKSIRRPMDLTSAFGISPIATVPYIPSSADRVRKRALTLLMLGIFAVGVPAAIYYINLNIYPMDQLVDLVIERLREVGVLEAPTGPQGPAPAAGGAPAAAPELGAVPNVGPITPANN